VNSHTPIQFHPIGVIHSPFKECKGMPIQPAMAQGVIGSIRVFDEFVAGLKDLAGFDRIWLLFWFHRAETARMSVTPYLDSQERGVFATRAPARPNPIGLSNVRLLAIEGSMLRVADLDILDGTPLLDIKPCVPRFDYLDATRCGWLDALPIENHVADDRFERKKQNKGKAP
jgi:tRNA-Thr(GGU) m(6)t(6)A37 methyltransferase TsaA